VPLSGGAGFLSNTISPRARHTSVPSFILIHPTVWSQYTNVTDKQTDGQDRQTDDGPITYGEPFLPRDAMLARY